jgi:hypothetical protein
MVTDRNDNMGHATQSGSIVSRDRWKVEPIRAATAPPWAIETEVRISRRKSAITMSVARRTLISER